jgi:hypothetical protein
MAHFIVFNTKDFPYCKSAGADDGAHLLNLLHLLDRKSRKTIDSFCIAR